MCHDGWVTKGMGLGWTWLDLVGLGKVVWFCEVV